MALLKNLITRAAGLIARWPAVIALFGFVSGVASYALVERSESLAQVIALLMLVSWLWLVLENWLREGILRRFGFAMPPAVMRYATQMVHQESLFFTLPFFLAVTNWGHGQALFTLLLVLCALVSLIDPLYYRLLAPRRSVYVAFHALALFAVMLVALPLMLHLSTGQSLQLALAMALLFSLPSLGNLVKDGHWRRLPLLIAMLAALAAGVWQAKSWVPPAALRLTGIVVATEIHRASHRPGASLKQIDAAALHRDGLYAWTAVRAPRGLEEQIHHVWLHRGVEVDRITLDIRGGREEGYRAWTHKLNFPADPAGRWQVRVVTDSGQLIGMTRFVVTATPPPAAATEPASVPPPAPQPEVEADTGPPVEAGPDGAGVNPVEVPEGETSEPQVTPKAPDATVPVEPAGAELADEVGT